MAGLGLAIDFDPPRSPSPPLVAPHPLVSRLHCAGSRQDLRHAPASKSAALGPVRLPPNALAEHRRQVRIASGTPVVLGTDDGEPVEEDYGSDLDLVDSVLDGGSDDEDDRSEGVSSPVEREYDSRRLRHAQSVDGMQRASPSRSPLNPLARSFSMQHPPPISPQQAAAARGPVARAMREPGRPRSMMELSQLYARQSVEQARSPTETSVLSRVSGSYASGITPTSDSASVMTRAYSTASSTFSAASASPLTSAGSADEHKTAVSPRSHPTLPLSHDALRPTDVLRARLSLLSLRAQAARAEAALHAANPLEPIPDSVDPVADDAIDTATVIAEFGIDETHIGRQGTLLSAGADPVRRQRELDRLLEPSSVALPTHNGGASSSSPNARTASSVVLEQAKDRKVSGAGARPRVELDVTLESELVVEGGLLSGKMEVRIRPPAGAEVWIGRPKARVVGFEELAAQDVRHIFYHHASVVGCDEDGEGTELPCFDSSADDEGFHRGRAGSHIFPFSMQLPIGRGAKGTLRSKQGVVRYIVIGSMKLKSRDGGDRSIAHFYRHIDLFPYFSPAVVLAPALRPIVADAEKSMFMGGDGKVSLHASMHRDVWVAGQRCYVNVSVRNDSGKKVKGLTLSLVRSTTTYRARVQPQRLEPEDPDVQKTDEEQWSVQTVRKKVAECALDMGKRGASGVTAKGMWLGVDKGEHVDFTHSIVVPSEALTILRGRHIEVSFTLKVAVSAGALTSDLVVEMPIRVINFVSLDPPPGHCGPPLLLPAAAAHRPLARSWSIDELRAPMQRAGDAAHAGSKSLDRMVSMDSLQLSDLNRIYGQAGVEHASDMSRSTTVARSATTVSASSSEQRQLKHQMSIDVIGSAIAGSRPRYHPGLERMRSASTLREVSSAVDSDDDDDEDDGHPTAVQLDDLDEVPDDHTDLSHLRRSVMQRAVERLDLVDEDSEAVSQLRSSHTAVVAEPIRSPVKRPITPVSPSRATSPTPSARVAASPVRAAVTEGVSLSASSSQQRKSYGYASPSSPLKVSLSGKLAEPVATAGLRRAPTTLQRTGNVSRSKTRSASSGRKPSASRARAATVSSAGSPPELEHGSSSSASSSSAHTTPDTDAASPPQPSPLSADEASILSLGLVPHGPLIIAKASPARKPTLVKSATQPALGGIVARTAGPQSALPSVKSKIAALESRQETIRVIAKPRVASGHRPTPSITSVNSEASTAFMGGNDRRARAESISSFKAPILAPSVPRAPLPTARHRREHSAVV